MSGSCVGAGDAWILYVCPRYLGVHVCVRRTCVVHVCVSIHPRYLGCVPMRCMGGVCVSRMPGSCMCVSDAWIVHVFV